MFRRTSFSGGGARYDTERHVRGHSASVGIFIYLWWAFRSVPRPFRYGLGAIVALVHDLAIVIGIFAILGNLLGLEVNTMFLVAVLTVIGYSVNDTIVVFDRLRENVINYGNRGFAQNVNVSISETIGRSLNTSLTLLIVLMALLLFGGATIRTFLLVLVIGVIAGTYRSIAWRARCWWRGRAETWAGCCRSAGRRRLSLPAGLGRHGRRRRRRACCRWLLALRRR